MLANEDKFRIFTGNANPDLAREIAAYLGTTLGATGSTTAKCRP